MAIIDVVKWNASDETYAWKYPSEELSTWTQLIVAETQEAVLLNEGQMLGPFKPGRHTLNTKNYPVISEFFKIPLGKKTPFTAEVWFVNKQMTLDVKWGTAYPLQLQDPKYKIMLPIRAFGQYGIQIMHAKKFLKKLVGTLPVFDRKKMVSYFRGLILTRAKNAIAKQIIKEKISILEISAYLNEISSSLESDMASKLEKYGIRLINFFVKSINTPEDDPAVVKLKDALARRAEMDIIGFNYQQERSYDTLETAAGNPGSEQAGLMGAGIGLGMGVGMGGSMGGAMGRMAQDIQLDGHHCSECNCVLQPSAKFCFSCGKPNGAHESKDDRTEGVVCDKCGTEASQGSRFCPKCGDPFICCPKCGTDNPEGSLKCVECSEPMPLTCKKCSEKIAREYTFCPKCGNQLVKKCHGCNAGLKPDMMFCTECGEPSTRKES